jgi:hypothetical protein
MVEVIGRSGSGLVGVKRLVSTRAVFMNVQKVRGAGSQGGRDTHEYSSLMHFDGFGAPITLDQRLPYLSVRRLDVVPEDCEEWTIPSC